MSTKEKTTRSAPARPFCLDYADAKTEVFDAVNAAVRKHGVPLFLMEGILTEVLHQVRDGAKSEMQSARETYQRQLEEFHQSMNEGGT